MDHFVQWHKDRIQCVADYCNLSNYQLLWISAIKGMILGYIVGVYL
ncbi:MAG: hypothetical protein HOJ16_02925 [Candidatus Peribacter sp.]|jgi:hypothetical protein|nr:hypothetical protein [Candidatus Peribacter sp.]